MRKLSAEYRAASIPPFRELVQLLLSHTVLAPHHPGPRLYWPGNRRDRADLAGREHFQEPLPLRDGRYLKMAIGLFLEGTPEGRRVKVSDSAYQYQVDPDPDTKNWIFRYDYIRDPSAVYKESEPYPYPQAHLQINAELTIAGIPLPKGSLSHVHFPTRRMPLEGVIRLLAEEEQFGVPCADRPEIWRPLLATAEGEFLAIAHDAPLGPS